MAKFADLRLHAIGDTIQLVGAIYEGEGRTLLCFFPEHTDATPHEVLEMSPDEWKLFIRQTDLLETEILQKAADGAVTKAIVRKSQRHIDTVMQWRVFKRDGYACRYCNNADVPLTVDHLVLWEEGGPTIPENLVSACKKCNKTRGNLSYAEWLNHPYYKQVSKKLPCLSGSRT